MLLPLVGAARASREARADMSQGILEVENRRHLPHMKLNSLQYDVSPTLAVYQIDSTSKFREAMGAAVDSECFSAVLDPLHRCHKAFPIYDFMLTATMVMLFASVMSLIVAAISSWLLVASHAEEKLIGEFGQEVLGCRCAGGRAQDLDLEDQDLWPSCTTEAERCMAPVATISTSCPMKKSRGVEPNLAVATIPSRALGSTAMNAASSGDEPMLDGPGWWSSSRGMQVPGKML
eukprot:Skav235638  [mRNA]  locus=scaffold358:468094:473555:- [translate_table: standard]